MAEQKSVKVREQTNSPPTAGDALTEILKFELLPQPKVVPLVDGLWLSQLQSHSNFKRFETSSVVAEVVLSSVLINGLVFIGSTNHYSSIQLIDGDGTFNDAGLDKFTKAVNLGECGLSYAVVSIMGPQSSGKSTLLNHLFGTKFREMDAFRGRSQTTKGIWMAKCAGIEPCTLVMDLEGTDGRERGEDDTTFEKQSALFALAVSDIVIINMWCHDIGREQAANKPLLKTVFQTPLEALEPVLREDIQKIWDSVPKPQAHKETPLSKFFNVEVTALSSYEEKEELFKEQVDCLRQRFFHSIAPGGLAGDRQSVVPASGFSFSAQQMWKIIKENKDLDLPTHKVMVATVRCEEIANEKFAHLTENKEWCHLAEAVEYGPVSGFGKTLSSIIKTCLSEYDSEAIYFDEGVRSAKRQLLEANVLQLIHPAYQLMLSHLRSKDLDIFKKTFNKAVSDGKSFSLAAHDCSRSVMSKFNEGCADVAIEQANWDTSKVRDKLQRDIDAHIALVRAAKLSELTAFYEDKLNKALSEPVKALLEAGSSDTWPAIRKLLDREIESAVSGLSNALIGFEMDEKNMEKMLTSLKNHAISVVEGKAREEAGRVLIHMKERFSTLFSHDADSIPRVWTGKEDIRAITKAARSESLKLLSVLAAVRLDDKPDSIEKSLSLALVDSAKSGVSNRSITSSDTLATSTWEEEANKRTNNWLPPPWAILALVVLGFNEFMTLLRNPLYLGVIFVAFLLLKALWVQLNISSAFQNGILPGVLSLSTRFLPTVMNLLKKLAEEGQMPSSNPQRNPADSISTVNSSVASSKSGVEHSTPLRQGNVDMYLAS
ncbi:hypothetical protein GIB67_038145 [Kingdonia uniflora]|uniref:Protein ROOT HAIR DEFECTIVE 3 homolog n=1 Tax=Kingdonia uniflora TaxID=39325 RepID=A0A7J7M1U0_9MAGN|nr:hypothetical protein GIB67_038145 [Kingdonia uniflora]